MTTRDELWDLIEGPIRGFCCQDAYASAVRKLEALHTGGCPNRCRISVPVPDAQARRLPAAYPCAYTRGHDGDCWMPAAYRAPAA